MITLHTAETALKEVYLGVLRNQLNTQTNPVLSRIKQSSSDVWGKEIRKLPSWYNNYKDYPQLVIELANMYGKIEISDKAIRCSENSAGAFVNLLNAEIESMLKVTQNALVDAFFTEDKGFIEINGQQYNKHDKIDVSGLKELFSSSEKIYGLERSKYAELNPVVKTIKEFSPYEIQEIIDNYNDEVDFMICNPKTKRKYQETFIRENIEVVKTSEGYNCILFNGTIPIIPNKDIPENEIYFISTQDFTLHQLCDWCWLDDENGNILKQVPTKPVYNAILVKYGNYICENPYKQIKIILEDYNG